MDGKLSNENELLAKMLNKKTNQEKGEGGTYMMAQRVKALAS